MMLPNTMEIILIPQGEPHPVVQEEFLPLACIKSYGAKGPFRQSDVSHADVMENINGVSLSQCLENVG